MLSVPDNLVSDVIALIEHEDEKTAAWQGGFNAAKAEYVPVLMEHLRILADLRAKVEALFEYGCPEWEVDPGDGLGRHIRKDRVLALIDGSSDE